MIFFINRFDRLTIIILIMKILVFLALIGLTLASIKPDPVDIP